MKTEAILDFKVGKDVRTYKTSLKKWLSKKIEFDEMNRSEFSDGMLLSVVEFDKDHCIYVLIPRSVFDKEDKI